MQVVQVKTLRKHGYAALQLGLGSKRTKRMPAKQRGHFLEAGVPMKCRLGEFRVHIWVYALALHGRALLKHPRLLFRDHVREHVVGPGCICLQAMLACGRDQGHELSDICKLQIKQVHNIRD